MSTLLIVDDHEDVRLMLNMAFGHAHRTIEAADGEQALAVLEREPVDLMLLDIMMPVLDGFGVLQRLNRRPSMPVVVVTGYASNGDHVQQLLEMGALDVIGKPFDADRLVDLVDAMLRVDENERQEYRQARLAQARGEN